MKKYMVEWVEVDTQVSHNMAKSKRSMLLDTDDINTARDAFDLWFRNFAPYCAHATDINFKLVEA